MARTVINAQATPGAYPVLPIGAGDADIIFTADDDPTDRYATVVENKTMVFAYNTDTGAQTITFTSVVDSLNRTGDIDAYSIGAGKVAMFGPFKGVGWAHSGQLWLDVSDPKIRLAVITLP